VWLVGSALLAATSVLVGCAVTATFTPAATFKHVSFPPGTACDATGCHTPTYFHPTYQHKAPYLGPCDTCHNLVDWKQCTYTHKDPTFDHGMHPNVGCATCHTATNPLPSPLCSKCHQAPHKGLQTCVDCHTTDAWGLRKPLPVDHVSLKGGHSKLSCFDCHKAPVEPATPRQCTNCHGTNHGGLTQCQNCHDPATGWNPKPGWSHSTFFVLRGFHKTLECAQCHINGRFAGTPRVCVGCHGPQHGGLTDCAQCHTTSAFIPPTFVHSSVFKLVGEHRNLKCSRCHPDRAFARSIGHGGTRCVDCHGPQHGGLTQCQNCHNTTEFIPPTFVHSSVFPLTGQHASLLCTQCHPGSLFFPPPSTSCASCHRVGGVASASASPHGGSVTNCAQCHTTAGFNLTKPFPGHPIPLGTGAGQHGTMACTLCHTSLVFSAPTRPCSDCHGVGGSALSHVPHVGPSDCLRCHWPTTWSDMHFTHPVIPSPNALGPVTHFYLDFGPYPDGCTNSCHPGTGTTPNFTVVDCLAAGCHSSVPVP
jgi:hypothetical protein